MNITQEKTGDLTATIQIELQPADYQEKVDKQLKDYQRKANMPGFRPGKVPFGMIKKMYGKAVIYDVVNKEYSDGLYKFLDENKIEILAAPLPNEEKNKPVDLDTETNFAFYFDIALAPEFTVDISESISVNQYTIGVTEETVDKYLNEMRKRYGEFEKAEIIEENDMISGEFAELDDKNEPEENGIKNTAFIYMEHIPDEKIKAQFLGLKKDDALVVDPKKLARSDYEAAYFIGKKKEELGEINSSFRFTITEISRNKPAELNEEFYKKIYPNETIASYEEMRQRIRRDAEESYKKETQRKLHNDITEAIIEKTSFDLPDAFLKRYLLETKSDEKLTKDKIEADYDQHKKVVKWQLIENKIVKEHQLYVTTEETKEFIKDYFRKAHEHEHHHEHAHENEHEHEHKLDDAELDKIAENVMKNQEEMKRINDKLFEDKLFNFLTSKIKITNVDVTYEDFVKLLTTSNQ
ncbi:MAG: trigger factor [Bacteroidales bacterium]|nr:trigger factor [Bacteroidales bacterium]